MKLILKLLSTSEMKRLGRLALILPFFGAFDALSLAVIIAIFLHIIGIRELALLKQFVQFVSDVSGQAVSERSLGIVGLIAIAIARFSVTFVAQFVMLRFISSVQTRLSATLFKSFLMADLDYISRQDKSFGSRIVFNECARYSSGVLLNALQIFYEALTLLIYVAILMYTDLRLSLFFIVATGATYYLVRYATRNTIRRLGELRLRLDGSRLSLINEAFNGFHEVGSYGLSRGFVDKYERATSDSLRATVHNQLLNLLPRNLFEILMVLALLVVAFFSSGPMSQDIIATLAIFSGAAFRCMPSINRIFSARQMMVFELPVVGELLETLRQSENFKRVFDEPLRNAEDLRCVVAGTVLPPVHFSRVGHNGNIELNIGALELNSTDLVLILGKSGSGKSTYLGCVAGLLTKGLKFDAHHRAGSEFCVSYAPQSPFILNDTLEANITLSSFFREREVDRDRLLEAVRVTQLVNAATGTPVIPFDKVLDGSGSVLSGGQRQRVALARALYFHSSLLILDEITSGLDEATERKFIESYASSHLRRATIFVTHRAHLASVATRVYRLENGFLTRLD